MRALTTIRLRLRSLLRSARVEQELDEELRDHLEREIHRHIARGLSPADARAEALRGFGNVALIQEQIRDTRRVRWIEDLGRDIAYAGRSMRRAPAFTAVAVLSLALGIGANTAIFSLIDTIILKTLPAAAPEQLFFVDNSGGKSGGTSGPPYSCYEILRDNNRFFAGLSAFKESRFKVTIDGAPEQVRGQYASGNYFDLLGVHAAYGRVLGSADDSIVGQGGPDGAVAVISSGFWQRRFGGDPAVLGRRMVVDTTEVTIVGVTPPEFTGLQAGSPIDVTVPMMLAGRNLQSRTLWWFSVIGRLKPDASIEAARADLDRLWTAYMDDVGQRHGPDAYFNGIALVPAARGSNGLRRDFAQPLWILMAIVAIVLLIGCANVANLLVARASARHHEIAVRLSLGASRARIVRQLVTESGVMVTLGSVVGLALARSGVWLLTGMLAPGGQGILLNPQFDSRVLAFTAVIAGVATLLFSLAPALHATRHDTAKPSSTGATPTVRPRRLRQTLVVVQITLSVALLCGAALFVGTLRNLYGVETGFQHAQVLTMQIAATLPAVIEAPRTPERRAAHARVGAIWEEATARVRALPGVASAGVATMSPLTGRDRGVLIRYLGPRLPDEERYIHINQVTAGFIETMGIQLLAGRMITERDRGGAPRVALLNHSAASKYFGGPSGALGRPIVFPGQTVEDPYEVVGVVRDVRYENLRTPDERMAYLPIEQSIEPITDAMIVVRPQGDARSVLPLVRDTVAAAIPGGFVTRVATMDERLEASLLRERLLSLFASCFGGLALMLAWIGLYGVMSYAVINRGREIATYVALGAPTGSVVWMVVREILTLVAIGATLGGAVAFGGGRYIRTQLFDIVPGDPAAMGIAVLLLLTVTAAAAYLPARRAARIDPVLALRTE